jgi:hypothetical protein
MEETKMAFKDLQPKTKQMMVVAGAIVVSILILAAAVTGSMDTLLNILGGISK